MVSVAEATSIIFGQSLEAGTERVKIAEAVGRVLAEPVFADRDLPPFNRVSMDGIAITHAEWARGRRSFVVEGTQAAGESQKVLADNTHCIEVMTGAVLPAGCDTVIRYEDVELAEATAMIKTDVINRWQSTHLQGVDARKGERILEPGQLLAPSEIALLASVGKGDVKVFAFPKVAIISSGDELVDINEIPSDWQIRRSNSYALQSALRQIGVEASSFHLPDEEPVMRQSLMAIVEEFDVLILSGGVSKGRFDFVPGVLQSIGIEKLFHEVSQRPGKPFWFGRSKTGKVAFALPGNPVSTFMCFYRYVRPWIFKCLGLRPDDASAVLGKDFSFAPPLTCFLQVSVTNAGGSLVAQPIPGGGSGDFANLKNVDGFLELPLERTDFRAGEVFPYIAFRH